MFLQRLPIALGSTQLVWQTKVAGCRRSNLWSCWTNPELSRPSQLNGTGQSSRTYGPSTHHFTYSISLPLHWGRAPQPAPPGLRNSLLPQIGACFVCASAIIQWVMFPTPANKQKTYSMYYEEGIHPISYIGHITFIIPWEFSTVKESLHTLRPTSAG